MSRQILASALTVFLVLFAPLAAWGQQSAEDILRTLDFRSGKVTLGDNLADVTLANNFRILNNQDTQTFLTKIWNNPPGSGKDALGLIIPTDVDPFSADGWVVVVSYDPSGYVSDEDAGKIDYDELMRQMQETTAEASKERVKQGYDAIELLGWARKPYYDGASKKLFWAKRLHFGNESTETLNYQIRILGRRGVLDLNVVAAMDAVKGIDQRVSTILNMVHFNPGNTYAEYDASVDQAAAYGLAGLIAGGVLVKTGLLKGLLAILLASKKLIGIAVIAALAGLWATIKGKFTRSRKPVARVTSEPPDSDKTKP